MPTPILRGLPPIENAAARTIVLGSFPSPRSLAAREYYAHPQNRFWRTVGTLNGVPAHAPYATRCDGLHEAGLALWDVLGSCARDGALDSAIVAGTETPNDFRPLFGHHRALSRIVFNGQAAARLFYRLVVPEDALERAGIRIAVLPSTSPANAAVRPDALAERWRAALAVRLPELRP